MLKPLLRTIPTMNGNVKISCELSDYTKTSDTEYQNDGIQMYDCYVRRAFISPLSHTVFDKKLKASLLGGSYDYDLKTFYTYYNDIFYSGEFPYIKTDMEMIDIHNPIYDRNIDFEMGCSRLVDHSGEIEFFAPVYVESYNDIPSYLILELKFATCKKSVNKKIRVNIIRNTNSKYNYLSRYLTKYSNHLDNSFINISPTTGQAIYNGIDLTHGGVCDATDNEIGNLFKQQNTINNFDAVICLGYKRNLVVMKQVLPLAFRVNPNNVLSASEKVYYKNATVTVCARYYGQDGKEYDFYDWECDYDEYSEKILRMSEMDGAMKWVTGSVPNIMDMDYPSLNEAKMIDYVHSNKLTKNYTRWKLKVSPEDHPYIVNMSIAFSKNQYSNYLYGQYPQIVDPITGLCETIVNETTGNNEYNLILPLGIGNANIYESANLTKYRNILNNYGYNWFDVIYKDNDSFPDFTKWVKNVTWSNVENDEAYYNGCLHKLDLLYSQIPNDNVEKIDKFGVFVKADINKINISTNEENTDDTLVAMYVLEKNTTSGNCDIYPENMIKSYCSDETAEKLYKLFNTQQNYTLMGKQSRYPDSLSVNGLFYKADNSYQLWTSYSYSDIYSTFSTYSYMGNIRYLNLAELGIYVDDLNVWYDGDDLSSTYSYIHNYVLTNSNISNILTNYQANSYFNANIDLSKDSQLVYNAISLSKSTSYANTLSKWYDNYVKNELSSSNSYTVTSYELLNLHNMGFLLDYDTESYTYGSKYQLDEDICYLYSTYKLICEVYVNSNLQSKNVVTYGDTNSVYLYHKRPAYGDGTLSNTIKTVVTAYSTKLNGISNVANWEYNSNENTMVAKDDDIEIVVSESLVGSYIFKDPIIDELYMSSKEDTSIRNCIGFTYSNNVNEQIVAYINFDGNSKKIGNSYQYSLFRKGNFIHKSLVDDLLNADLYEDVYNYCNRKENNYDVNDLQDTTSLSYALLQATYICNDLYYSTINNHIQSRYEFMPAVFQNGTEYANNIFINKEANKKQYGNHIPYDKIDDDIDVVWVDAYNIQHVLEYYEVDSKDYITKIKKFKARFLNKTHIWWWYAELCKNYNYVRDSNIDKTWCDHIYIKEKAFKTINGKITIVDTYTSLKDVFDKIYAGIDKINIEKGNCINLYAFKQFYDVLENDIDNLGYKFNRNGIFGVELPDYLKTEDSYFELAFDLSAIRLDQDIYEKIMQIEDGVYKDLYLYKVESENSWEHKYQNIQLIKPKYTKNNAYYEECGNELVPVFNDIYVQNKKDTEIYANYHLNNLTKIGVYDNKGNQMNTFYKVNAPNISWMYKLSESEFNSLISIENCAVYNEKVPVVDEDGNTKYEVMIDENGLIVRHQTNWFYNHFGKEIYDFLYYKADTGNVELTTDCDDLNYGIKYFNTRKVENEDGTGTTTNYGYYLITLTLDNTLSSLNINSNDSETGYVKYFKYINGISLIGSPNYFEQLYKQILPFAKVQPTSLLRNISTLQKPIHIELDNRFKQTLCFDKNYVDNNITEVNTVVTTTSSSTNYDRYFGNISPYITQRSSISNQWLLKKKNSNYGMITNGNYPSIGDCVIKKTNMPILSEHKYVDYIVSTNNKVKNYNNVEQVDGHNKQIDLPENKHFNVSKIVNLPSTIEYKMSSLYTYAQLQELETDEEIYKVFIRANKGTNLTSFTNDEILFLFNRYDYTTSSTPVKLSKDKATKLYRLKYIFTLK